MVSIFKAELGEITEEEIATKCIELWGKQDQIRQSIEELSELIVVLAKWGRNVNGSSEHMICDEIADVEIMCKQLRLIFNSNKVDCLKKVKLERLYERVDEESKVKV
jgi:hypothetical protein